MDLPVPESFYAETRGSTSIEVHWQDVADAEFYKIYLSEIDDIASASLAAIILQGTGFAVINNLNPEYPYFVWIEAGSDGNTGILSGSYPLIMPAQISGALDIEGIKTAIWSWAIGVITAAGLSDLAIWANQDGTTPQTEHVQLGLAGPMMIGAFDEVKAMPGEDQVFAQEGMRSFLVSVNVYSPDDAVFLASRLQSSLSNPVLKTPLVDARLGVGKISDVRDLSEFLESRWDRRAQFDFTIFVRLREEVVQDVIDRVQIQHVIPA